MKKFSMLILCLSLVACPISESDSGTPVVVEKSDPTVRKVQPRAITASNENGPVGNVVLNSEAISVLGKNLELLQGATIIDAAGVAHPIAVSKNSVSATGLQADLSLTGNFPVGPTIVKLEFGKNGVQRIDGPTMYGKSIVPEVEKDEYILTFDNPGDADKSASILKSKGFTEFSRVTPGGVGACAKTFVEIKDQQQRPIGSALNLIDTELTLARDSDAKGLRVGSPSDPIPAQQRPAINAVGQDLIQIPPAINNVIVAVLDTGVFEHQEFIVSTNGLNVLKKGANYTKEGNPNGPQESNFDVSDTGASTDDPAKPRGHGTPVASIIAALDGNGGMVGAARGVNILPVKVCITGNKCGTLEVIQGICYAIRQKADVINLSFGGTAMVRSERDVLQTASDQGIVVVAAAGNKGTAGINHYPAAFSLEISGLIAVGSVSETSPGKWTKSDFSNAGNWLDVMAPGENIWTATADGVHVTLTGTSFAAPWISGAAAILKAKGYTDVATIKQKIKQSAAVIPGCPQAQCGTGIIRFDNLFDALVVKPTATPSVACTADLPNGTNGGRWGIGVDGQGNIYSAGSVLVSAAAGDFDFSLNKYNSNCELQWSRSFGSTRNDASASDSASWGFGLVVDQAGNSYIMGVTNGDVTGLAADPVAIGGEDIAIFSYDSSGTRRWVRQLNGNTIDTPGKIVLAKDGLSVYVFGSSNGALAGPHTPGVGGPVGRPTFNGFVLQLKATNGLTILSKQFADDNSNTQINGTVTPDGSIIYRGVELKKLSSIGTETWTRSLATMLGGPTNVSPVTDVAVNANNLFVYSIKFPNVGPPAVVATPLLQTFDSDGIVTLSSFTEPATARDTINRWVLANQDNTITTLADDALSYGTGPFTNVKGYIRQTSAKHQGWTFEVAGSSFAFTTAINPTNSTTSVYYIAGGTRVTKLDVTLQP
jgi:hypothetical protein